MNKINLWEATEYVLNENGRSWIDVEKVGTKQGYFKKETFEKIAKETFYHARNSAVQIAEDLAVQGKGFVMKWSESECWEGWEFIETDFIGEDELINIECLSTEQAIERYGIKSLGWNDLEDLNKDMRIIEEYDVIEEIVEG